MDLPTVSPLPEPPTRSDDSDIFAQRADAWVAALTNFAVELDVVIAAIPEMAAAVNYNTSSSSPVTIGTGVKSFTAETARLLQVGQFVIAASAADPSNYLHGQVESYDSGTGALTIDVISKGGAGTHSDWIIAVTVADSLEPVANIAVTGSGADLVNGTVSLSKIENITNGRLVGRYTASVGVPQLISLGAGLSLSTGGVLSVSTGTATLGDGDYSDIVVSSGGTIFTVDAGAITFAKMQDVSADTLLGRSASGTGDVQEVSCTAAGRALLDDADAAAQRATLGLGSSATMSAEWAPNFTAAGDVYIPAAVAMTIAQGNAKVGTGTLAYAKSTSAAPGTFAATTLPATMEAGAWLRVSASAVTGFVATHLKRTA